MEGSDGVHGLAPRRKSDCGGGSPGGCPQPSAGCQCLAGSPALACALGGPSGGTGAGGAARLPRSAPWRPAHGADRGNRAAELFTWAARDAAAAGCSALNAPGFADYRRALDCWGGAARAWPLPLQWDAGFPAALPQPPAADVLWITNPHNPSGQLWSRAAIEPLLAAHRLVIVDEAFLPLVRSLTKLYGLAGLRLGYALGAPARLQRWARWRDPWPVNGLATALALRLLSVPHQYRHHCAWVQAWCQRERDWLTPRLAALQGPSGRLQPLPSAANYLLLRGDKSLVPLRERLERRDGVLLRDCRSFEGLDERWLRLGLQDRRGNRRLLQALRRGWAQA
mgnify:CR=1 FL=1